MFLYVVKNITLAGFQTECRARVDSHLLYTVIFQKPLDTAFSPTLESVFTGCTTDVMSTIFKVHPILLKCIYHAVWPDNLG